MVTELYFALIKIGNRECLYSFVIGYYYLVVPNNVVQEGVVVFDVFVMSSCVHVGFKNIWLINII